VLNKRALESLVKAGALDCINPHRAQVFNAIDGIIGLSNRSATEQAAGQNDLFGGGAAKGAEELVLPAPRRLAADGAAGAGVRGRRVLSLRPSA
jgi:DNA polymerase III alpha subunit